MSFILAFQSRMQVAANIEDGRRLTDMICDNAKNVILYPGINPDDTLYYSKRLDISEDILVFGKRKGRREGQIVYGICRNSVLQRGKIGYTNFIPKKMNIELNYDLFAFSFGSIKVQDLFIKTHLDLSNPPKPSPTHPETPIREAMRYLEEQTEEEDSHS